MNKFNKILIFKGQLKSCPLLFLSILWMLLVAVLPACSKKPIHQENTITLLQDAPTMQDTPTTEIQGTLSTENLEQIEIKKPHYKTFVNQAKNIDITTPVGFKLVKTDNGDEVSFFEYQGKQSIEKTVFFYTHELEIAGWDFRNLSTKQEGLFVCNNASKLCVISIRAQDSHATTICITMASSNLDKN
jgi:hypothetical protein